MLKAILFDMDDTLIDWSNVQIDWEQASRKNMSGVFEYICANIQQLEDQETFLRDMWHMTAERWANARHTLTAPHMGEIMLHILEKHGINRERVTIEDLFGAYAIEVYPGVEVFDDVLDVLPELKDNGIKLGLVTNAAHPIFVRERELRAFGLDHYLDEYCRLTAADVGYLKPHPEIFRRALDSIGAKPEEVVFVGDSVEADIVGAQAVGMKAVLRRTPYREDQMRLVGVEVEPDATVDTLHELYPLLDEWYPNWRKPSLRQAGD